MSNDRTDQIIVERILWYEASTERTTLPQAGLLERTEPLVILGEAGMGKSHLLEWIATNPGYAFCTARQLINRHDPRTLLGDAGTLVIDALDEVSASKDGDAVDLVLRQLGKLDYPRFVLSCRASDWRSATGTEAIVEQYTTRPIELFLESFTDADAIAFLSSRLGMGAASVVVQHFNSRGLDGLLGNPQTLGLIARVAASGNLPDTRGELFRRATELLRIEHRDSKAARQPTQTTGLDAAGAALAALILTGNEAITRRAGTNIADGEIAASELTRLPGGFAIEAMLDTRLFRAYGPDRFSYAHRRIGEFLGAQWLAKLANTPRKRRRLLSLFHAHGLVPSSLRGIHAWLARDPALAQAIIRADPLGVVEYGDAHTLSAPEARWLLDSLRKLADGNPHFYDWGNPSAQGLFQGALIDDVRQAILSKDSPFGLRLFLLKSARGTPAAAALATDLRSLVLDAKDAFAIRSAAGESLAGFLSDTGEWQNIIIKLREFGDDLSARLAIELLGEVGYQVANDDVIVDLVISHALTDHRTVGILYPLERELPLDRIDGVLDRLAPVVRDLGEPHSRPGDGVLTNFGYTLLARRMTAGDVAADKLWTWLEPFDVTSGYQQEATKQLDEIIRGNVPLRRAIQRLRLLEEKNDQSIWQREHQMCRRSAGFGLTSEDVVALLQLLDPNDRNDERWRKLVRLVPHEGETGVDVRCAARPFAAHRPDLLRWIDSLATPSLPRWQVRQTKRERRARAKRAVAHADHRRLFSAHIQQIRSGDFAWVIDPAMAYLRLFNDISKDLPAHERIEDWLGPEVARSAYEGFEAFLLHEPPTPSATDITEGLTKDEHWNGSYIIVAAIAERVRNGRNIKDLPDERLMASLFAIQNTRTAREAGIVGIEKVIETELSARGKLKDAMKLYCEPRLREARGHIDGVYLLMRDNDYAELGTELASEWLGQYANLPADVEAEMITRLVRSDRTEDLRRLAAQREGLTAVERRRNWAAASLIADFSRVSKELDSSTIEPELLWHLRDLVAGSRRRESSAAALDLALTEWIVSTFRPLWPMASHPAGGWAGSQNPWDASDYLTQLLRRLGGDPSEQATAALERLQSAPSDGYTDAIRSIASEQSKARVESRYVPPPLSRIEAVASNLAPVTAADLQAVMLEELSTIQAKVRSDDAESWRGFFDDDSVPYNEERCRDHLLGLLRQGADEIQYSPEEHVAGDKEIDIACSVGSVRIPIEVKGQWNQQLWHGIDTQLDRLYASDWRAERRGIYLVLWFGDRQANKRLISPGRGRARPRTPDELASALTEGSIAARDGRTSIFVLDLSDR